jgi:hypothetical protein
MVEAPGQVGGGTREVAIIATARRDANPHLILTSACRRAQQRRARLRGTGLLLAGIDETEESPKALRRHVLGESPTAR